MSDGGRRTEDFESRTQLGVAPFPCGCCEDATLMLAAHLSDNSLSGALRILGEYGGVKGEIKSYVWLDLEGVIIDVTADQFNRLGYNLDSVIVADVSEFHRSFTVDYSKVKVADFRLLEDGECFSVRGILGNYRRFKLESERSRRANGEGRV